MKILYILFAMGGIVWFIMGAVVFLVFIGSPNASGNSLDSFRSSFLLLGFGRFAILFISIAPLALLFLIVRKFKMKAVLSAIALMALLGGFVLMIPIPKRAQAMMKLPLVNDANNVKYRYDDNFDYAKHYIEFNSNQTPDAIYKFYTDYFKIRGYDEATAENWRWYEDYEKGKEYICFEGDPDDSDYLNHPDRIKVIVEENEVRIRPNLVFGKYCLDKL